MDSVPKIFLDKKRIKKLTSGSTSTAIKSLLCIAGGYGTYKAFMYGCRLYCQRKDKSAPPPVDEENSNNSITCTSKKKITKTDVEKLIKIFRILIPSIWTKQFGLVCVHTCMLITRAWLSVYVATLDGSLTKSIVEKDLFKFLLYLAKWIAVAVPATFVNSLLKYLESKISLMFRTVLVGHAYNLYFDKQTYYKVGNLDSRLTAVDESLVEDLNLFCNSVSHLYSHLTKPVLDVVLLTTTLVSLAKKREQSGLLSGIVAVLVIVTSGQILKKASPKFGKFVAEESARRGNLRTIHSRIINNAEEIAFYGGHNMEQTVLMNAYQSLAYQINISLKQKLWYIALEQFLMKYVWSATGLIMVALPIMLGKDVSESESDKVGERTQSFTTARSLLLSASDAMERLISSLKEITELAGYTERVYNMFYVFEDVHGNNFVRVSQENTLTVEEKLASAFECPGSLAHGEIVTIGSLPRISPIYNNGSMDLKNVPIITPSGDVVCPSLSLQITPGTHFLITGPNGCGKSSLFRILSGLWPVYGGELSIPFPTEMFYIPQRPYMSIGTFRDQIIYPDEISNMKSKGWDDEQLENILDIVHLKHVLKRERGWDSINDWMDLLSGGEKQRIAMARMFYHKPKFALLDECTSAVSIDVEGKIYQSAKDVGITLLTITHRPSLWKFHDRLLKFDGQGDWTVEDMNTSSRMSLKEEKERLQSKLADVPQDQKRLDELCVILGES